VEPLRQELEREYKEKGYRLAVIPNDKRLSCPRMSDVVKALRGQVLSGHNYLNGLVRSSMVCAMQLQNALKWFKEDFTLLVTSGDRGDIVVGALQAHQSRNYPSLAGIILTGGVLPDASILRLVDGLPARVPIVSVQTGTFEAASLVNSVHARLRSTDQEKISLSIAAFESHMDDLAAFERSILGSCNNTRQSHSRVMTPKMFMYVTWCRSIVSIRLSLVIVSGILTKHSSFSLLQVQFGAASQIQQNAHCLARGNRP